MPIVAKSSEGLGMPLSGFGPLFYGTMWLCRLWVVVQSCVVWKIFCNWQLRRHVFTSVSNIQTACSKFIFGHSNAAALITMIMYNFCWYIVADETLHLSLLVVANFSHPVCAVVEGKHEQTERTLALFNVCVCVCLCVSVCVFLLACEVQWIPSLSNPSLMESIICKPKNSNVFVS